MMAYTGTLLPKGVSEVYKRIGTYVIWASKRGTKGLTDEFMALKSRENVTFL